MARPKGTKNKKVATDSVKGNLSLYKVSVKVMGKVFESTGETVSEALSKLYPQNCKGRAIITVDHDGISKSKILASVIAFRLFNTLGLSREIAIKNASLLFQGL